MKKNDNIEIQITDLTTDGSGIGKHDDIVVFVEDALIGETVCAKIILLKKNYAVGKKIDTITPSPLRVKPKCKYFSKCGGCSLQHLEYAAQLDYKHNNVESCLKRIGKIDVPIGFPLPSKNIYRYRNKGAFPVQMINGSLNIGFYKKHSHTAIDIDDCLIQHEDIKVLMSQIRVWIISKQISIYDETSHSGLLRHIVVKTNYQGHIMLVFVANGGVLPHLDHLQSLLKFVLPQVKSIVLNVNKEKGNVILGNTNIVVFGRDHLLEVIGDLEYKITPSSFLQVNHAQTEALYNNLFKLLDLQKTDVVADLYCGIGTISLGCAPHVKKVYGVEIVKEAVDNAEFNSKLNDIKNVEFFLGDVDEALPKVFAKEKLDVIIVDPPRKGLSEELINIIAKAAPSKIGYVSCNPATLARDLALFKEKGYICEYVQSVDMFPHTVHVETVCLLSKLKSNHHIEVNLNMDELDLTSAESKATYEEIKEYVLENSGFKVSSLYIGQVKEKMGIKERENYNISKKEDAKVPKCPADKEKAIVEALKHFNMID